MKEVAKGALQSAASTLLVSEKTIGSISAVAAMDKAKAQKLKGAASAAGAAGAGIADGKWACLRRAPVQRDRGWVSGEGPVCLA
jgi:hypothetical protein